MASPVRRLAAPTAAAMALLLLLGVASFAHAAGAPAAPCTPAPVGSPLPTATIDLAAPAAERWLPAVRAVTAAHGPDTIPTVVRALNTSVFSKVPVDVVESLAASTRANFPAWVPELQGLASAIDVDETLMLGAFVWYHELAHTVDTAFGRECTGVLAQDAQGNVVHGRNMDNEPTPAIRNATVHLTFVDSSAGDATPPVLIEAISWYVFIGGTFETAVKPGVASTEENWRFGSVTSASVVQAAKNGVAPQGWLFRRALLGDAPAVTDPDTPQTHTEQTQLRSHVPAGGFTTYADVQRFLATEATSGPVYFILSGPGAREGAIVTRSAVASPHPVAPYQVLATLEANTTDAQTFLVQTNYDRWLPDPQSDHRRTDAITKARTMPQELLAASDGTGMGCLMSTPQVLNSDTLFTAVMRAAEGILWVIRRDT